MSNDFNTRPVHPEPGEGRLHFISERNTI